MDEPIEIELETPEVVEEQQEVELGAEPEPTPTPRQLSETEIEASQDGWTDKETWIAEGKDPERWVSAYEFVRYGKLKKALHDKTREAEERISNLNKYHQIQLENQLNELKAQQRQAIEYSDVATYDAIQTKIDALSKVNLTPEPVSPQQPPEVMLWEAKNKWIYDNSNKAREAKALFAAYMQNDGATYEAALNHVDTQIAKLYPVENPRRTMATPTETNKQPVNTTKKKLGFDDLTDSEKREWKQYGRSIWGDDDNGKRAFLKAVADARGKNNG